MPDNIEAEMDEGRLDLELDDEGVPDVEGKVEGWLVQLPATRSTSTNRMALLFKVGM